MVQAHLSEHTCSAGLHDPHCRLQDASAKAKIYHAELLQKGISAERSNGLINTPGIRVQFGQFLVQPPFPSLPSMAHPAESACLSSHAAIILCHVVQQIGMSYLE